MKGEKAFGMNAFLRWRGRKRGAGGDCLIDGGDGVVFGLRVKY